MARQGVLACKSALATWRTPTRLPPCHHPLCSHPQLIHLLRRRQAAYRTTIEQDDAIIADPTTGPRQTVAARLLRIEKQILAGATQAALALPGAAEAAALGPLPTAVKME